MLAVARAGRSNPATVTRLSRYASSKGELRGLSGDRGCLQQPHERLAPS